MSGQLQRVPAQALELACRGARTQVGEYNVSTVHLVIDHNHSLQGPPILFETMVFKGDSATDLFMERYATEEAALVGHANIVGMIQAMEDAGTHD